MLIDVRQSPGIVNSNMLNSLYDYEIGQIKWLQGCIDRNGLGEFLQNVSRAGDPVLFFTLYFPFVCGLSWTSGVRLLYTGVICEWLNQVLKWLLFGERPYWYIGYIAGFSLHQNPVTCETGPGQPSGHAMLNMVTWLVVADTITWEITNRQLAPGSISRVAWAWFVWFFYIAMQLLISISRVYSLCHFPHQCLSGLFCGMLVVRYIYEGGDWTRLHSLRTGLIHAFFLGGSALALHKLLDLLGLDPDWSIDKAVRWCQRSEWIHIETTPFFGLSRYTGAAAGLAFGVAWCEGRLIGETGCQEKVLRTASSLALGLANYCFHKTVHKSATVMFNAMECGFYVAYVFCVVAIVPFCCRKMNGLLLQGSYSRLTPVSPQ